jgi:hypothetical protein
MHHEHVEHAIERNNYQGIIARALNSDSHAQSEYGRVQREHHFSGMT